VVRFCFGQPPLGEKFFSNHHEEEVAKDFITETHTVNIFSIDET
jgi:hypothetical protein